MEDKFADIVNTSFTANMEKELDDVESGQKQWRELLQEFYGPFRAELDQAEKDLEGVDRKSVV